jgi:hypothetical protein
MRRTCTAYVLPAAARIKPSLTPLTSPTPLAAAGLVTIMVLASIFHITRGELSALPFTFTLGALAGLVAWGRAARADRHVGEALTLRLSLAFLERLKIGIRAAQEGAAPDHHC